MNEELKVLEALTPIWNYTWSKSGSASPNRCGDVRHQSMSLVNIMKSCCANWN